MDKKSRIFVAGHRGLVGSAIVRKLNELGFENLLLVPRSELDLRNQKAALDFFRDQKPEYVFLAAARVGGILANSTYKAEFIYENLMIAANVIHASYLNGVKRLMNLGSSCIYPKFVEQPIKEKDLLSGSLEPTNEPYAIAKISAVKLCRYYDEQYGTDFYSAMPTNLYGPGDNFNLRDSHVLPALLRKFHLAKLLREERFEEIADDLRMYSTGYQEAKFNNDSPRFIRSLLNDIGIDGKQVTLWGTGEPFREFLHVEDLSEACVFLMRNHSHLGVGELVNIGSGEDLKVHELAHLVKDVVGFHGTIGFDSTKPDGTPRKLLDITKIRALGWKPRISLPDGIRSTYEWYRSQVATRPED